MTAHTLPLDQGWAAQGQPLSIREQIMAALLARAQTLLPAATRDPVRVPSEKLPQLIVQDQTESGRDVAYKKHQMALRVVCEYADQIDIANHDLSSAANYMLANLLQALLSPDLTLGGLCQLVQYETSSIDYQDGGDPIIRITVGLTISYGFALGNPFSLT